MKIWKLMPIHGDGYVRIRAQNESRAREIAADRFEETNVSNVIHTKEWSSLSWQDPNSVKCELEDDDLSNEEGILDLV
jgi:hypothetical protein